MTDGERGRGSGGSVMAAWGMWRRARLLNSGVPLAMSEGWEDWPLLGPGWKRRTAVRKSGNSCGHSDTYYQSPTGQRFRSKPELAKFLGDSVDLTLFNFKHGTLMASETQPKTKKKKKSGPKLPVETKPEKMVDPDKSPLSFPLLPPEKQEQNGTGDKSLMVRCNGCKTWFTGVEFGRTRKRTTWYCADCRASRREFNKEQRRLSSTGCGKCDACVLTEDCGHCSICVLRLKDPELGGSWKCTKRRCLKAIHKPGDCGLCQGCTATEDCEACPVCLKRQQNPNQELRRKCVKRRCLNKKTGSSSPVLKSFSAKKLKLKTKWKLMAERDGTVLPSEPKKKSYYNRVKGKIKKRKIQKKVGRRRNRKCGTCEACQRKLDCSECDFCQDKPKFGGRNLKRQKCRWRQCLRFAAEKNIPVNLKSSNHPVILERLQKEKSDAEKQVEILKHEQGIQMPPRLPIIKLERLDCKNGGLTATGAGSWVINSKETKAVKDERVEHEVVQSNVMEQAIQDEPLDLHCPVKTEEFVVETDDVEGPDESTPVITQIFSLGSLNVKNDMEQVLVEFLNELNEIPLPAHWEVLPQVGPTLQLVQRSKSSTMSETVVHIQPGLHFHIVVREYTVPSCHELFRDHPSRLTTVDEVVELICDLEAYRPCAGLPRRGLFSPPNCAVLTVEEWCSQCRNGALTPWPSGYGR